jgi:cell wall-associated NlpC family hydrolase
MPKSIHRLKHAAAGSAAAVIASAAVLTPAMAFSVQELIPPLFEKETKTASSGGSSSATSAGKKTGDGKNFDADLRVNTDCGFCSGIDPQARTTEVYSESNDDYQFQLPQGEHTHRNIKVHFQNAFKIKGKYYDGEVSVNYTNTKTPTTLTINKKDMSISVSSKQKTKESEKEIKEKTEEGSEYATGDMYGDMAEDFATHSPRYNYVLGGRALSSKPGEGIDCAHFVGLVYKKCGTDLTSSGADQNVTTLKDKLKDDIAESYEDGPIPLSKLKRGDIIIFYQNGAPSHTAIYLGDGVIAHAADEKRGVTITDMDYNESTGVAGYNGKTLQYAIRIPKTKSTKHSVIRTKKIKTTTVIPTKSQIECEIKVLDPDTGDAVSMKNLVYGLSQDGKSLKFINGNTGEKNKALVQEEVKNAKKEQKNALYYSGLDDGGYIRVNSSDIQPGHMIYNLTVRPNEEISIAPVLSYRTTIKFAKDN